MVGWTLSLEPPRFPKDDKDVSPRKTPESINTRPCQHWGSGKHWDYGCKHSRKGERQAQANFITLSDPEIEALNAYDGLYYRLESDDESAKDQQGFCEPLQSSDWTLLIKSEDESSLEGSQNSVTMPVSDPSNSYLATAQGPNLHLGRDLTNAKKFPLN